MKAQNDAKLALLPMSGEEKFEGDYSHVSLKDLETAIDEHGADSLEGLKKDQLVVVKTSNDLYVLVKVNEASKTKLSFSYKYKKEVTSAEKTETK